MKTAKQLCFYHPTTVIVVDDNQIFLDNLPPNLSDKSCYKLFNTPLEALEFFQEHQNNHSIPDDFYELTDDLSSGITLNVNISKIHKRIHNINRFNTLTVLLIDHEMPGINGIEFCKKLQGYPIKKIMLTGVADDKLAIQAFNDGIINKFILKNDPAVFEIIDAAINDLQHDYFSSASELIIKNITTSTFSLLNNQVFQNFFADFISKNEIIEFYLTDAIGSFLLSNREREIIRLVVQSDEQIENYLDIAKDHDASTNIIHALQNREKLVCLFSEEDHKQPVQKWNSYLHEAKKIKELDSVYYSLIEINEPS